MATSSTLGLLFEINADPSKATAAVQASSAEITSALGKIEAAFAGATGRITAGHQQIASNTRESTEAFRGLGEEIGVRLPRFVSSFLSHIDGIGPIMSMAFAPIAVIGLIEVLARVPDAIDTIIGKIADWDKEAQKTYGDLLKMNQEQVTFSIELASKWRELNEIGLTGSAKQAAANDNEAKTIADKRARLYELGVEINHGDKLIHEYGDSWMGVSKETDLAIQDMKMRMPGLLEEQAKLVKEAQSWPVAQEKANREFSEAQTKEAAETAKKRDAANKAIVHAATELQVELSRLSTKAAKDNETALDKEVKDFLESLKKEEAYAREFANFQIELMRAEASGSQVWTKQIDADFKMVMADMRLREEQGDKQARKNKQNWREEIDYLGDIQREWQAQIKLMDAVGGILNSLSTIFGKNAALQIAAIAAVAITQIAVETAAGMSALGGAPPFFIPDPWAAAQHFAAAAAYGIAAGANISSSVGSGDSSSGSSASGSSAAAPGGSPASSPRAMAPGAVSGSGSSRIELVVISDPNNAGAKLAGILNKATKYQGVQLAASHSASGELL